MVEFSKPLGRRVLEVGGFEPLALEHARAEVDPEMTFGMAAR